MIIHTYFLLTFILAVYLAYLLPFFFGHGIWDIFRDSVWLRSGKEHSDPIMPSRSGVELLIQSLLFGFELKSSGCCGSGGTTAITSLQLRSGRCHF